MVQPANASSKTATNTSLAFTNDGAPVVAHVGGGVHFSTILTQDNSGLADWATKTITTGGALKPEIIINEMNRYNHIINILHISSCISCYTNSLATLS